MAILDDGTYAVRNGNLYKIELLDPVFKGAKEYHIVLKKESNADRIRNMTDEELVEWICKLDIDCDRCLIESKRYKACRVGNCEKAWLEWLKQECTDG